MLGSSKADASREWARSRPTFHYTPLLPGEHSFRLLRVLRSLNTLSVIQCELFESSIDSEEHSFIAGSYVWGPPEPTQLVLLNGALFQVRENLYHFLRACRSKFKDRIMWIDAMCINQDDAQEKSVQVQRMNTIYRRASAVYSWFGWQDNWRFIKLFDHNWIDQAKLAMTGKDSNSVQVRLRLLASTEYFRRMWILQEFVVAKEVYLLADTKKISWRVIEQLLSTRMLSGRTIEEEMRNSKSVYWNVDNPKHSRMLQMHNYRTKAQQWDFEDLFYAFGSMACSLPQDRVFALAGLVNTAALSKMIDYEASVWQLLHSLITWTRFEDLVKFVNHYAENIIVGAADASMHESFKWVLGPHHRSQTVEFENQNCVDVVHESSTPHFCLQYLEECRDSSSGDAKSKSVRLFLYTWLTSPSQPLVLLSLVTLGRGRFTNGWGTEFLIEPCQEQCKPTCVGHNIIGFAMTKRNLVDGSGTKDCALSYMMGKPQAIIPRSQSLLHKKVQSEAIPAALKSFQPSLRIVREEAMHVLQTSLETFVALSRTILKLEEAFAFEFSEFLNDYRSQ